VLLVSCKIRHTPAAAQPHPSQEGNYRDQACLTGFLRESPVERGVSSVVKMEEAGCVKIRITEKLLKVLKKYAFSFKIFRRLPKWMKIIIILPS
jgi:hypothetical protein